MPDVWLELASCALMYWWRRSRSGQLLSSLGRLNTGWKSPNWHFESLILRCSQKLLSYVASANTNASRVQTEPSPTALDDKHDPNLYETLRFCAQNQLRFQGMLKDLTISLFCFGGDGVCGFSMLGWAQVRFWLCGWKPPYFDDD